MDSQYLNEFLDGIPNERLKKQWSDAAQGSGRRFVVRFQQEMDENEVRGRRAALNMKSKEHLLLSV